LKRQPETLLYRNLQDIPELAALFMLTLDVYLIGIGSAFLKLPNIGTFPYSVAAAPFFTWQNRKDHHFTASRRRSAAR